MGTPLHPRLPAWVSDNTFFSPHTLQGCLQGLGSFAKLDALKGTLFRMESRGRAIIFLCLSNLRGRKKKLTSHFVKCWLSSFCSARREEPAAHAQYGKLILLHSDVLVLSTWSGQAWGLLGTSASSGTSRWLFRFLEKLTIYRLCQHCCLNSQGGRDRQQHWKVLCFKCGESTSSSQDEKDACVWDL